MSQPEAFSRILIDRALTDSGWDLLNTKQVRFEVNAASKRADYLLLDSLGRTLCVLEAKAEDKDPYDAKEQARGYETNPLEVMAYVLQACFDHRAPAFDVAAVVGQELDRVVPALLQRAANGSLP